VANILNPLTIWRFIWRTLFVILGVLALLPVVVTPLDLRAQVMFALIVFVLSYVSNKLFKTSHFVTLLLVVTSIAVSTRYIYWRTTTTLTFEHWPEAIAGYILVIAEFYAFLVLLLGYLQSLWPLPRVPAPLPENVSQWPTVDVYVPTYNESLDVVRTTVLAAQAIDWPLDKLKVYILDDGRRDAFRAFAAEAGVGYIVRPDNKHAKAGNLNHAMTKTRGEYIAIFDCDHVPTRSFLQVTMGWFLKDQTLSIVQTPHHFYSADPFEKNLQTFKRVPNEGELFYGLIQPCNDTWNAAFFCGSCAVIRREALIDVGGVAVETVTEDAHTALRMQRKGWSTAYLRIPQAAGLATESLSAHVGQRIRWARGMAQIFRIDNPLLGGGLTFLQRLCYLSSMVHFFNGIPRLIFYTAPLCFLIFGMHIFNALPLVGLAYALPHLFHTDLTNGRVQGQHRHSLWSQVYESILCYYIAVVTTKAMIDPKAGGFNVTAKGGRIEQAFFERAIARPYLILLVLNCIGIIGGIIRLVLGTDGAGYVLINLLWTSVNVIILLATLAVAWEERQVRSAPRILVKLPAMLRSADGRTIRCQTLDLARGGAMLSTSSELKIASGERIWLTIFSSAEERGIPAEVVLAKGSTVRVKFGAMSIEEESALVQAMFSRADAWVDWDQGRPKDQPLLAYFQLAMYGIKGVRNILRGMSQARQEAKKQAAPATDGALAGGSA
jgi:cellulose synthase (UDP-forming)